jgi:hypothetical protein
MNAWKMRKEALKVILMGKFSLSRKKFWVWKRRLGLEGINLDWI